jgi:PAS domain S-box-containing protein
MKCTNNADYLKKIEQLQHRIDELENQNKLLNNGDQTVNEEHYRDIDQASNQQLRATEQQLRASNQQLRATEQQLRAFNQQLEASNQQLKATTEMLRQSEELNRATFEQAAVGIARVGQDGKWLEVNQKLCDIVGYRRDELLTKTFQDITHPDDLDTDLSFFNQMIADKIQTYSIEKRYFQKNYSIVWINLTVGAVRKSDRSINYFISVIEDISDRKRAEEERRKSDERFRIAQEMSPDGFTILGPVRDDQDRVIDFIWIYENDAVARMNGTDPQKVVGQRLLELFPGHQGTQFFNAYKQVAETGKPITFEEAYAGETIKENTWFRIVVVPMAENIAILSQDITERKRAEETLNRNKALLDATGRMAKVGGWEFNADTLEVTWTEETYRIHDVPLDYKPPLQEAINFFHLEDRPKLERAIQRALDHGEPYDMEVRFITANGKHLWTRTKCEPEIVGGKVLKLKGTFQDITERKQSEFALKESEERFKALHNASFGGIAIHDKGIILECNRGMSKITGFDYDELIGMEGLSLISDETRDKVIQNIETGYEKPYEATGVRKNGEKYPLRLEARNIPYKGKEVRVVEFRDISDQKKSENVLRKSEEKYRLITENMSDVVSILDMNLRFTYASPSIKRLTGLSPEAFISQFVEEIMPPEYFEKVTKVFEEEMMMEASGNADPFRTRIIEFEQYTQDRSTVWVEVSCSFLRDKEKHPVGILAISRDISDRKQAEIDLRRRIDYEQILSEISSEIAKSMGGNIDQAIERTLAVLCNFAGADRSYIFQFKDNFKMDNTHEFCVSGIEPQIENLKDIDVEDELPWFMEHIKKRKIFNVSDVAALPEQARLERAHFKNQEIKSLIVVPIQTTESLIGFIGFDAVRKHIEWNDDDKSLLQYFGNTLCHVIEAQRHELALQKREFIFSQTFEQSSTSTCFYDPEGTIIRVNEAFCKMFGVKEQDILNAEYNMFKDETLAEEGVIPIIREIFEKKKIKHWEINFDIAKASASSGAPTAKPEKIFLEVYGYPVLNYQNELEFVVLKHYDITKRKQAEESLISLERRNQALLDHSPVCHKIVDLDFNLQYMSGNGFKMLKLDSNSDVYGKSYPFYFFPETFRNMMTQNLIKVKNTGKTITMEALANDVEGDEVWLDSSLIPVFDDKEQIDYITIVSANITQRKRDESEKGRLEAQLQQSQKLESIGTLAGGIAHDFNNILSSLIGFTELALDDVEKGSPVEDSLQEIYTGGKRARDLVKQILAFARQSDDAIKPIQIDMIAKEVLKLLRASIPTTIKINQNIEKNLTIMGNPTQFHQMLVNICTNAAQAMEKGGGVLGLSIKGTVINNNDNFDNLNAGEYAEIKISDTGMGIDPEIMDKIFDPYFTTKGIGKGTGMGLALVHGIIQAYSGMITADSLPGKGTVFTVYLPLIRSTGEPASYQPEKLPTGDERILLVDDEAPIVKMSSQILQKLGYMVVPSTSGLKALELFRSTPEDFDLVITDMTMPGITGDKLAAELMSVRRDIPVILCTGYSNQISEKTAADIGIKAFAYKPVSKNDLANTVRKVLDEVKNEN